MAHLLLLRENVSGTGKEVLIQKRGKGVPQSGTWGLPGGRLESLEKKVSCNKSLPLSVRSRVRRLAALREAIEEMGSGDGYSPRKVSLEWGGKSMGHFSNVVLPEALFDMIDDDSNCYDLKQCNKNTYFTVVLLRGLDQVLSYNWEPKPNSSWAWEVDQVIGMNGYFWVSLERLIEGGEPFPQARLCTWVRDLFVKQANEVRSVIEKLES